MAESRGHLNPGLPGVVPDRFELGLEQLVRHVWVIRWSIPPGRVSTQRVLTYPACNIVFGPTGAALFGPDRRATTRDLTGDSWVVGVLFRPAATPHLTRTPPDRLVGRSEGVDLPTYARIVDAMRGPAGRDRLTGILRHWLAPLADRINEPGRLVNDACRRAEEQPDLTRTSDLARQLNLSPRSLERLVRAHAGVTPKWLIECRRMQYAATTLYAAPDTAVAGLAAELGFADHAHFTRRYRTVLGETPEATRRAGTAATGAVGLASNGETARPERI